MTALGKGGREDEIGGVGVLWGYVTPLRAHARREWMKGIWGRVVWAWRAQGCGLGTSSSERAPRDQPAWPAQRIAQGSCGGGLSLRGPVMVGHTQRPDGLDLSGDGGGAGPPERTLSAHSKELQWIPGSLAPCSPKSKPLLFAAAGGYTRADGRRERRNDEWITGDGTGWACKLAVGVGVGVGSLICCELAGRQQSKQRLGSIAGGRPRVRQRSVRRGWQQRVEDRVLDLGSGWSAQAARVSKKGSFGFFPWPFLTCERRPDRQQPPQQEPSQHETCSSGAVVQVQQLCGGRCSERCAG